MSFTTYTTTPMAEPHKLTASATHGGYLHFLKKLLVLLVSFGAAADEFFTGVASPPRQPNEDDRRPPKPISTPTSTHSSNPIYSSLSSVHPEPTDAAADTPDDASEADTLRPFIYAHHGKNGELSVDGYAAYSTALTAYNRNQLIYNHCHAQLLTYLLTTLHPSVHTLLDNDLEWPAVLRSKNAVSLKHILDRLFTPILAIRSISSLTNLLTFRRPPNSTLSTFHSLLRTLVEAFAAAFQDALHPGYVKIDHIHTALLLTNQPAALLPLTEKLLLSSNLLTLTTSDIETQYRHYEQNIAALNRTNPHHNSNSNTNQCANDTVTIGPQDNTPDAKPVQ
jgi:hypothetical protein